MDASKPFDLERVHAFIDATPIADWLGFSVDTQAAAHADTRLWHLAFTEAHIGNPIIRALHGGVISAFLELAMQAETIGVRGADRDNTVAFRSVSFDVDFLTSSKAADMNAAVTIERMGRRLVFLSAYGWQADQQRPVARARLCLRLAD